MMVDDSSEQLQALALMTRSNPAPIIALDAQKKITYLNEAARKQFPDLQVLAIEHPILHNLSDDSLELRKPREDSYTREVHVGDRIYEQKIVGTSNHGFIIFCHDVTARKRIERVKDELLGIVSHELRTPLAVIKGSLDNLRGNCFGALTEKQALILKTASNHCDRMGRLIHDLLDLSRLESDRAQVNRHRINIASLIDGVMHDFQLMARDKHLTIEKELAPNLPPLYADPDLITQVLSNFLTNAVRFTKKKIVIRASSDGSALQISVMDDGAGISSEDLGLLFEKFVQINRGVGSGYKGTGLGLAICREIVELHQGKIWAESEVDRGASFHFSLPIYGEKEIEFWSELEMRDSTAAEGN